jgi:hypothetical protein
VAALALLAFSLKANAAPALQCTLEVPAQVRAGTPALLRLTLHNPGRRAQHFLEWGTPFEPAWFAPYVSVFRGDVELPYGGAKMKRGDPPAAQYQAVPPGGSRSAGIDLAQAFDLGRPGHYRVRPMIVLHDVVAGAAKLPRPRSAFVQQALACKDVSFDVTP